MPRPFFGRPTKRLRNTASAQKAGSGEADGIATLLGTLTITTAANQPPVAVIAQPQPNFTAIVGSPVTLDSTGTFDPNGPWNGTWTVTGAGGAVRFTHTGTFGVASTQNTTWTPTIAETVTIAWAVTDQQNVTTVAQVTGTVAIAPVPTTLTLAPSTFGLQTGGQQIILQGTVKDQNGVTMSGQPFNAVSSNTNEATVATSGMQATVTSGSVTGTVTITGTSGTLTATSTGTISAATGTNEPVGFVAVAPVRTFAAQNENGWTDFAADGGFILPFTLPGWTQNPVVDAHFLAGHGTTDAGIAIGWWSFRGISTRQQTYLRWQFQTSSNFTGHGNGMKNGIIWVGGKPAAVCEFIGGSGGIGFVRLAVQNITNLGGAANFDGSVSLGHDNLMHTAEMLIDSQNGGLGTGKIWIDNVLAVNASGIGWPGKCDTEVQVGVITWGGGASPIPNNQEMYFDNVYCSQSTT